MRSHERDGRTRVAFRFSIPGCARFEVGPGFSGVLLAELHSSLEEMV